MGAIFLKEIRQYFRSMIGYIFLTLLTLICGFIFTSGNLLSQNGDIKIFFSSLFGILMFLIPMLTMRQFSEEQKLKTQQLLFTLPLSTASIVTGKFLATLCMIGIGLSTTLFYPFILGYFAAPQLMVTIGNYLGILLLISSVTALGLYISTLTENQVIASLLTYGIILILWLVDSLAPTISQTQLKTLVRVFSLKSNYIELSYGIFNPAGILYFFSLTLLFLLLTIVRLDSRRQ